MESRRELLTIQDLRTWITQPERERLVVVKVVTSEPGLYGLGCATFTQRAHAVQAMLDRHLKPLLIGRDVSRIEDIWQMARVNGYWRNGPVINNALSGIDQALWDILGKRAGLPVHDLLGGKCREAALVYRHADGESPNEVVDNVESFRAQGYRHVRVQLRQSGGSVYGTGGVARSPSADALPGAYYDPRRYMRDTLSMLEFARSRLAEDVELLHDVHERLSPPEAVQFAKDVEQFRLFFLEDPLPPEHLAWLPRIREQTSTPIAMGELFNHPMEWQDVISARSVDYIRMHVSQMGGLTPARKVAAFAAMHGIRTAWHGPADTSPIGHAANLHLELASPNFGIHEWCEFGERVRAIFPGTPEVKDSYLYPNTKPGLGVDFDEKLAQDFPPRDHVEEWTQARLPDGTAAYP
ncbi:MAG TPA: enolase C-terminal domain-like protein [Polyangiaceae bacterium]|jgi:mannonate dehydratase